MPRYYAIFWKRNALNALNTASNETCVIYFLDTTRNFYGHQTELKIKRALPGR